MRGTWGKVKQRGSRIFVGDYTKDGLGQNQDDLYEKTLTGENEWYYGNIK